uniref:Glycosyltransferase family 2 protein n=1 Tax=Dictyoglomus turgidum TaxID=513050 RepID=A0A7C3SQ61_9BACT
MKKFIATTTINNLEKTSYTYFTKNHPDWTLVISGDSKTDDSIYEKFAKDNKNVVYLSLDDQKKMYSDLHFILKENTDTRKMFSIYYAYTQGADVIALVDDDNYPIRAWGQNILVGKQSRYTCYFLDRVNAQTVDPIFIVKQHPYVWHRGYPLKQLKFRKFVKKKQVKVTPYVQTNLWYGEPDVDGICRLLKSTEDFFSTDSNMSVCPFVTLRFSPFNSQNTILHRRIVPYYFLFSSLGRMSDIWISYYIESLFKDPIVVYDKPTVFQRRNPHDIILDIVNEKNGYYNNEKLLSDISKDSSLFFNYITSDEKTFYLEYLDKMRKLL